jgi:hypothetical protein
MHAYGISVHSIQTLHRCVCHMTTGVACLHCLIGLQLSGALMECRVFLMHAVMHPVLSSAAACRAAHWLSPDSVVGAEKQHVQRQSWLSDTIAWWAGA